MGKYFIVSNSGLLFEKEFDNDENACKYIKRYFYLYVTSCLSGDQINLYNPDKNCLLSINAACGNVCKDWRIK